MQRLNKEVFILTGVSLIIGFLLAVQYQSTMKKDFKDSSDVSPLRQELQSRREQNQNYREDIEKYKGLLNQYQASGKQESVKIVMEESERLKEWTGLVPVEGKGIILMIEDKESEMKSFESAWESTIYDEDIRYLINELFGAGAKHISINGHRLTPTTYIRNVGEEIFVDTKTMRPPYEIRALGDPKMLEGAIELKGFRQYFDIMNKELMIKKEENVTLPSYKGKVVIRESEIKKD